MLNSLCAPALIYLCFSLTQIIIDVFKTDYTVAFYKFWVMMIFTILINTLCSKNLGIVAWILVFIPFMLMSMVTLILILIFGLNPFTGKISYGNQQYQPRQKQMADYPSMEFNSQIKGGSGIINPGLPDSDSHSQQYGPHGSPPIPPRSESSNGTSTKIDGCLDGCNNSKGEHLNLCKKYKKLDDETMGFATCPQSCKYTNNPDLRKTDLRDDKITKNSCFDNIDCNRCPWSVIGIKQSDDSNSDDT